MNMKSVLTYNCNILDDRTKKGLTEIKPSALKFCYAVNKEKGIEKIIKNAGNLSNFLHFLVEAVRSEATE